MRVEHEARRTGRGNNADNLVAAQSGRPATVHLDRDRRVGASVFHLVRVASPVFPLTEKTEWKSGRRGRVAPYQFRISPGPADGKFSGPLFARVDSLVFVYGAHVFGLCLVLVWSTLVRLAGRCVERSVRSPIPRTDRPWFWCRFVRDILSYI